MAYNFIQLLAWNKINGVAMNSTGANWRLLSATHIAKSFGFVFSFFLSKQNPKDFADFIKIHKPFDLPRCKRG